MKGADEPAVPSEISSSKVKNPGPHRALRAHRFGGQGTRVVPLIAGEEQVVTRRTGWVRFEIRHMEIVSVNTRVPINLFNVLAAIFWLALSVLAFSVAFLYLSKH